MKCPKCGNSVIFLLHQEVKANTRQNVPGRYDVEEITHSRARMFCRKCNTLIETKSPIHPPRLNKRTHHIQSDKPRIAKKGKKQYKVSVRTVLNNSDEDYEIVVFTTVKSPSDCSKCDARRQGRDKLLEFLKKLRPKIKLNIVGSIKVEEA